MNMKYSIYLSFCLLFSITNALQCDFERNDVIAINTVDIPENTEYSIFDEFTTSELEAINNFIFTLHAILLYNNIHK